MTTTNEERAPMIPNDPDEHTRYLVCGLTYNPNPELDGMPSTSVIILGSFRELEKAVLCRDIYADLDTTMEAVTITTSVFMDEVPDFDVFLSVSVVDGGILLRSQCVAEDTEPWLREEADYFEALAYPEDEERILELASEWYQKRTGHQPEIIDDVSDAARELMVPHA